jgi:hypothetical protein
MTRSATPWNLLNPGPDAVAIADLGNGHPDLVVANSTDNTVSVLLGNGNGTFQPQQIFAVGGDPNAVAVADPGNGHPDIIVANKSDDTISLLPGNGDGTFGAQQHYAAGNSPVSVAVANLGDGHPDVVVGNQDGVIVLPGNGRGALQAPEIYPTGDGPIALVDLGNGYQDIIVGDTNGGVLLNNGDGTFQSEMILYAGEDSIAVTLAKNGQPELVMGGFYVLTPTPQNLSAMLTGSAPSFATIGGALGLKVSLTLTAASDIVPGLANVKLLLSPDQAATDHVMTLVSINSVIDMKPGQTKDYRLSLRRPIPKTISPGRYHILIQLLDTSVRLNHRFGSNDHDRQADE